MPARAKKWYGVPPPPLRERFEAQYVVVSESGCWIWTGVVGASGYGQIKDNYRTRTAHRVAWTLYRGEVPPNLYVCHRCDIRCCVNPDHLFVGTPLDNVLDMWDKGRAKTLPTGEDHPNSTISDERYEEIMRLSKVITGKAIAERFGISRGYVSQLINGKRRANANQRAAERGFGSAR